MYPSTGAVCTASPDVAYAATSDGTYQTIDGGDSWSQLHNGIPNGTSVVVVAIDPLRVSTVVAYSQEGQIFRATNGGASWKRTGDIGAAAGRRTRLRLTPSIPALCSLAPARAACSAVLTTARAGARPRLHSVMVRMSCPWQPPYARRFPRTASCRPLPVRRACRTSPPRITSSAARSSASTNSYGGLRIFGLPLTEAYAEHGMTVQFFERAEMVLSGGHIHLGALGAQLA